MDSKFGQLKKEATAKFNSLGTFLGKIKDGFVKFIRRIFPGLPPLSKIADTMSSFSLRKSVLKLCIKICGKLKLVRAQSFFEKALAKLDDVRDHVLIKYICKELFMYFLVCFFICFVIFFVNEILVIIEKILKQGVPFRIVVKLLWYFVPNIVSQSAPFATLIGFLMCLGRMVTDNEVLILRASGQKYSIILIPVLIMGLLISLVSFVMNDYFMPLSTIKYNQLMRDAIAQNPAIELESNSIKRLNDKTLVIGTVEKDHCSDMIFFDNSDDGTQRIIVAQGTDLKKASSPGVLMEMKMSNTDVLMINSRTPNDFDALSSDAMTLNVFESSIIERSSGVAPREMTSFDLLKKTREYQKKQASQRLINNYKLEFDRKFAVPFGSIFFAMLAFPLSLIFGKKDGQTLGMIFGIILCVLYWCASFMTTLFGLRMGIYNIMLMWGPNVFLGSVGVLLYVRLKRK